jgi:nucleotide-binding universal stress UspA family protein
MPRIRRILHPSDFSRASGAAFTKALEMAKTNRAELLVVHVLAPFVPMVGDGYVPPNVYEEIEASARSQAQAQINRLMAKARKAGVRVKGLLMDGVPHEQITRAARSKRADLIVIGTRSHGACQVLPGERGGPRGVDRGVPGADGSREVNWAGVMTMARRRR